MDSLGFFLAEKIEVLLDNESASIRLAARTPSILDYAVTIEFNRIYTNVGKPVEVRQVLGHKGVLGNKAADRLAKEGVVLLAL